MKKKIFVMGIDAMDPKYTQKCLEEGIMPNLKKLLERGAARDNLAMIGGHPTVTPPMWTTLCTGASPYIHGVTEFAKKGSCIGEAAYNFDSRNCMAEQLWNVTAEAGLKTLVWHWAGSAWPPTMESDNLWVVDGTQPEGVNCGNAVVDEEKILVADEKTSEVKYRAKAATDGNIPCFITGMEFDDQDKENLIATLTGSENSMAKPLLSREESRVSKFPIDVIYSPIRPAKGWGNAPTEAKECTIIHSKGLIHRPCLILKNADGIYDTLEIYLNKKATEPLAVLKKGEYTKDIIDDAITGKTEEKISTNRNMRILDLAEDGSHMKLWISSAMDYHNDTLWYPKALLPEIIENVGYPQPCSVGGGRDEQIIRECIAATWDAMGDWTAESIKYLAKTHDFKMIFSHFHNVDLQGHMLVQYMKNGNESLSAEVIQQLFREVYIQTDRYIGHYLDMLDDGWTILIVSDHGQTCPEYHIDTLLCSPADINGNQMVKWGFTTLKENDKGELEVDWSKTKAVIWRIGEVWINLKGRDFHNGVEGIVDPAEQWELEEEIMTHLLAEKSPVTGQRMVMMALRNKDAIVLGMGGPNAGDILYYAAEGYTFDHADSLSTVDGVLDTSCMSIFVAAGPGIKENCRTNRVIKHVDVVPTIASLLGVRMPKDCEGAPVYQIMENGYYSI